MLELRHKIVFIFYVKKRFDLVFILAEVNWVVTSPCPTKYVVPVRETKENDAD